MSRRSRDILEIGPDSPVRREVQRKAAREYHCDLVHAFNERVEEIRKLHGDADAMRLLRLQEAFKTKLYTVNKLTHKWEIHQSIRRYPNTVRLLTDWRSCVERGVGNVMFSYSAILAEWPSAVEEFESNPQAFEERAGRYLKMSEGRIRRGIMLPDVSLRFEALLAILGPSPTNGGSR